MEAAAAAGTMVVEATTMDLEAGRTVQQDRIHTPEQNKPRIRRRAPPQAQPMTFGPLQAPQATTIMILTHRPIVEAPAVRLRILTAATTMILRYTTYTHLRAQPVDHQRLITATRTTMTTGAVAIPATIRVIRPTTVMLTIMTLQKRRLIRRPTKCDWMQRLTS